MDKLNKYQLSRWIKDRAIQLGFSACGISEAGYLDTEAPRLSAWLGKAMHGEMDFMERNLEKRLDPRLLVEGAKSVISFLLNYYPKQLIPAENNYHISKYAYGKRYQQVIRKKLVKIIAELNEKAGPLKAQAFSDSAPVLDKYWAQKSGLGWIGKNTLLLHPEMGSFHFLGEIITDFEFQYDQHHVTDLCGNCTKCIDHCPTGALEAPRTINAGKCIAYLTIEESGDLPQGLNDRFLDWIYGCDICQDVCPWNRKASPHDESAFDPHPALFEMKKEDWEKMDRIKFARLFRGTPLMRAGYDKLLRNILYAGASAGNTRDNFH